ncbi:hypothetical protein [Leptolinea tardivitalis]|uniref:KTSC domain-containing protein n=1 Tax=Leptolinea tardivitalis TaxID=229920 RepID=A0A0N8GME8_9CHLR|nr:hypothetical protein [Leptolinea tardivitalis]KPL75098.1 hypothetical protein ADM99_00275 [Leptolinea tardivitalis]GAP20432.1 hypothetical protein LTAR_00621 [Leptolinea tardivitalis]
MNIYSNLGGNSGVIGYEIGPTFIIVQFKDGSKYLYNYDVPGPASVEKMKSLALAGVGLNSYISSVVKKNYAAKL